MVTLNPEEFPLCSCVFSSNQHICLFQFIEQEISEKSQIGHISVITYSTNCIQQNTFVLLQPKGQVNYTKTSPAYRLRKPTGD